MLPHTGKRLRSRDREATVLRFQFAQNDCEQLFNIGRARPRMTAALQPVSRFLNIRYESVLIIVFLCLCFTHTHTSLNLLCLFYW